MYAIVDIAGKQVKIEEKAKVKVPFLGLEEGDTVTFDRILLASDDKDTRVGTPILEGARAEGKVLRNGREKKVLVFKKIPRKGFDKKNGHRQLFTEIEIEKIVFE